MQCKTKTHKIQTQTPINLRTVKWAQWDKTQYPENCKNCSSKCAYDCAQLQYTIQHRTVLKISPLTSRRNCLNNMLNMTLLQHDPNLSVKCVLFCLINTGLFCHIQSIMVTNLYYLWLCSSNLCKKSATLSGVGLKPSSSSNHITIMLSDCIFGTIVVLDVILVT